MTRSDLVLATALLTAVFASAQATTPPAQNAPAAPTQTQSTPNTVAPAAGNHRVLQAKSKEEMDAYNDAKAIAEPAKAEAAADDFSAKYPTSELRALYMRVMSLYGQENNTEKVIATGRQAITADPTNPIPLVQVARPWLRRRATMISTANSDSVKPPRMRRPPSTTSIQACWFAEC